MFAHVAQAKELGLPGGDHRRQLLRGDHLARSLARRPRPPHPTWPAGQPVTSSSVLGRAPAASHWAPWRVWGARARWRGPARSSPATASRSCRREARPRPERVAAGLALLRSWGLEPDERPGRGRGRWIFSADDDERRRLLQAALDDEGVSGRPLLSAGGYGTQRIVDDLDVGAFVERRRAAFVGLSDATPLIAKLNAAGLRGDARPLPGLGRRAQRPIAQREAASDDALLGTEPFELHRSGPTSPTDWDVAGDDQSRAGSWAGTSRCWRTCVGTGDGGPRRAVPSCCSRRTTRRPVRSIAS